MSKGETLVTRCKEEDGPGGNRNLTGSLVNVGLILGLKDCGPVSGPGGLRRKRPPGARYRPTDVNAVDEDTQVTPDADEDAVVTTDTGAHTGRTVPPLDLLPV